MNNSKMTDFKIKVEDLLQKSFTPELLENQLVLDSLFNNLDYNYDNANLYQYGDIMGFVIDLNDHNKTILATIIKDFDSYNELVDLQYSSDKEENQTDLISIIDYIETKGDTIYFDVEWGKKGAFSYR